MSPRRGLDVATILEIAAHIADNEGLDAVTLAAVAKELRIRSPSLYNHVPGLDALRDKLGVYGLQKLLQVLTAAAVGRSGDEAIKEMSRAYLRFAREHPGMYEATLRVTDRDDAAFQQVSAEIVALVVRVLSAYDLTEEGALHAVRGLRSILHGFASLEQRGQFRLPLDLDTSFGILVDTFLAGIASPAAT